MGTSLSQQEKDGGQEGRDIPKDKEESFAFTIKKKKCRFSFVFIIKRELRSSSLGHEVLSLEARERHSL